MVPFGLQGSSSLLMRVMNEALTVALRPSPAVCGCMPGASAPLGRCALAYMDDCLVHSPTLQQYLLDPDPESSRSCFHGWGATRRARRHWPSFGPGGQRTGGQQRSGSPAFRRGTTAPPQGPREGGGISPVY